MGGDPRRAARSFALRSPLRAAAAIAASNVAIQVWRSRSERVVLDQRFQSRRLVLAIRRLAPHAHLLAVEGNWVHSAEMRPFSPAVQSALARLGLLPRVFDRLLRSLVV